MLPTSNADLTDEEFDELEQFLNHDSGLDVPMSLSEIDGLLTAVLIGPVFPPPSQWIPLVWGDGEGPCQWPFKLTHFRPIKLTHPGQQKLLTQFFF